jgi:imidazolonepropionase-like amidohydrolase
MRVRGISRLVLAPIAIVSLAAEAAPPVTVIRGAAIFDSEARVMIPAQSVVIAGERIAAVGPAAAVAIPPGARVVDAAGKYAVPGLIDAHAHVVTVLYWAQMTGDELLPFYLAAGVTTLRNTGDSVAAAKLVARFAEAHPDSSPRIFLASPLIDGDPPIHRDIGWGFSSPDQVPPFLEEMRRWGVTTLKIYARCPPDVARRVIEEGHRLGFVVTGHLGRYPVEQALADGIDCLEHIESVSDFLRADPRDRHSLDIGSEAARRLVAAIAARKVWVDPTLMVFWGTLFFADLPEVADHPDNARVPERLREFWARDRKTRLANYSSGPLARRRATFRKYMDLVAMLHRAGVPLLAGTDAPEPQVPPGTSLHHELELLVESGVPAGDALAAATLNNARVLRQEANLGGIRAGKLADLVLLDANPLDDIRNTRRIHRVVRGGRLLDPAAILRSAPTR